MDKELIALLVPGIALIIFGSNLAFDGIAVPVSAGTAITNIGLGLIFLYEATRRKT